MPGADRDPLLDSRIDAALRSYAEPPASISDPHTAALAILERARQSERHRRSWWFWGIPASAAAALIVLLAISLRTPPAPKTIDLAQIPPAGQSSVPPHAALTAPTPSIRRAHAVPHHARSRTAPLPQQAVFPTPAPLSRQEQALLVFIHTAPPTVRKAVIAEQSRWNPADTPAPSPMHPVSQLENEEP